MSEEEKKAIKALKIFNKIVEMVKFNYMGLDEEEKEFVNNNDYVYNTKKSIITVLNLIEKQQKELNNLKEIEQRHREINGKLRVEVEQEKEKNNELEIELSTRDNINVDKLVEKYKYYRRLADSYQANCISKDKLKEKIELLKDILKVKEKDENIYKQIPIEYLKCAIEQLEELLEGK